MRQVPCLTALTGTRYGQLLLVKIALVALVLVAAALSRTALRGDRYSGAGGVSVLTRGVAAETLLLALVVMITSGLVASTPARIAYRPVQGAHRTSGANRGRRFQHHREGRADSAPTLVSIVSGPLLTYCLL